jgi:uncharacterized protein YjbI with pentapeptide repeats
MTIDTTLEILKKGHEVWNEWRKSNNDFIPNLRSIILPNFDFTAYNLGNVDFSGSDLSGSIFIDTDLWWTVFVNCNLQNSTFESSNPLRFDDPFYGLNIRWSNFSNCDLSNAKISNNLIECSHFVETKLNGTDISNNRFYGVNVWNIITDENTKQNNLIVTAATEPIFVVDNLEFARLIDLFLNNEKIKDFIDISSERIVLILGSFDLKDKIILDKLKLELLKINFIPVLYDFTKPKNRNHTETVSMIAHLSKFIIGDLTNQRSIPHELASIIPRLPSVPIIPICQSDFNPYSMFTDFKDYKNVCDIQKYDNLDTINQDFLKKMIDNLNLKKY